MNKRQRNRQGGYARECLKQRMISAVTRDFYQGIVDRAYGYTAPEDMGRFIMRPGYHPRARWPASILHVTA